MSLFVKNVLLFRKLADKNLYGSTDLELIINNGTRYYLCPECNAKNHIVLQGENIFLDKIINFEL
jgi:Zn finger protein HypA/HybF involved in hydrogenase expression